jgi:hypothetical protein
MLFRAYYEHADAQRFLLIDVSFMVTRKPGNWPNFDPHLIFGSGYSVPLDSKHASSSISHKHFSSDTDMPRGTNIRDTNDGETGLYQV